MTTLEPTGAAGTTAFGAQIQNLTQLERIGAHSHIRGLGISSATLVPADDSKDISGLIGQVEARRALAVIHKLIVANKMSNRAILLAGPPGTGKTALALALARELGSEVPFVVLSGSEIYSVDIAKTEVLTQSVRRACAVKIKEEGEVIQGEVVEIQVDTTFQSGTGKSGKMTMKTTDMETVYDLGEKMIAALQKERVQAGDVITIDKVTGNVTKLGRSYLRAKDYDATGAETKFVKCPEGELQQRKEVTHTVSLHEIDVINSRSQGFLALFSGDTGEIKPEVREQIDAKIRVWLTEGRATLAPGILFIDEVHMLDVESFAFLSRVMEDPFAPVIVMASNRGRVKIRGSTDVNDVQIFGIPADVLDRCLTVRTHPYKAEDIRQILKQRMDEEEIRTDQAAEDMLVKVIEQTSLRYGMQLLTVSWLIGKRRGRGEVHMEDVEQAYTLFLDEKRSVRAMEESVDGVVPMQVS